MKKKLNSRVISFFMSLVMLLELLPIVTYAALTAPTIVSVGGINVDPETNMGGAPVAMVGEEYSAYVTATGAELTYTAGAGNYMALPAGLTIDSETGLISGTCTAEVGRYNVYIEVSNSAGTAHAIVGITVGDSNLVPVITTEAGSLGTAYKNAYSIFTVSMNNDKNAASDLYGFEWSRVSGSLPSGMNLVHTNMPTVYISGIPTETGTFTFELKAENDFGSNTKTFSIEVVEGSEPPTIIEVGGSLGYGVSGEAYIYQLEATGTNSQEDPMTWSTDYEDFSQDSYALGNGLFMSKTGLITGIPKNNTQVSVNQVYAKNSAGIDDSSFFITIYDNGEATSVSVTPEIVVMEKGTTKEFTVSLEGYGTVEQVAYWDLSMYDDELKGNVPRPTDSELNVGTNIPSGNVTLTIGEDETREQFRVVAYSKPENGGVLGYATVTVIDKDAVIEKTELSSITGTSSLDAFLVEGGTLPDTSAQAMPIPLSVGYNYNMETTWQKKDGQNWVNCEVGATIEENGQYRLATTIIVDEEDFEQYKPAANISLTIDGNAWTTDAPTTGVDNFYFRAYSPIFTLENSESIFTLQPQTGDVNINNNYTVNWGLKYEPDAAPIVQFYDNGNWTTLENSASKTSTQVSVFSSEAVVRQCRVMATYQNASQNPFYVYSNEFTVTWHGKYEITVTNGAAYDDTDEPIDSAFYGDTVMLKADTIQGKTFKSWSITGGNVNDETAINTYMIMPKNAVTAEATYTDNSTYAFVNQPQDAILEYNENYEGTWSLNFEPTSVQIEKYNEQHQQWDCLSSGTKTGGTIDSYDFNVSNKYRVVAYNNGVPVYSNEFTVTWESQIQSYEVTFDANGGEGSMDAVNVQAGEYTLPECEFTAPSGMQFKKWSVNEVEKAVGDIIEITEDTVVKAIWENIPTPISFASATIVEPAAGENPSYIITPTDSDKYTVSVNYWHINEGNYDTMQPTDTFIAGKNYGLRVTFLANNGYEFTQDVEFEINNLSASSWGSTGKVQVFFEVPEAEPTNTINTINITGITTPTVGASPVVSGITTDTEGIVLNRIQWQEGNSTDFGVFESEVEYTLYIEYTLESGYELANDATITANLDYDTKYIAPAWFGLYYTIPAYTINLIGYDITNTDIAGGTLYLNTDKGSGEGLNVLKSATQNTYVTINAVASEGYEFVEWRLSGPTGSTVTTNANHTFKATEQLYLYAIFQEASVPPTTYTVTFESNGGSEVAKITNVTSGEKIEEPTAPTKADSTFAGWYKEEGLTNKFNFATDTITSDTTLYAKWEEVVPAKYTVTFESNGGSAVTAITNVISGEKIEEPTAPTKADNTFAGWYKDAELTMEFNFATDTITSDTTLYAKWNTKQTSGGGGGGSATTKYTITVKQNDNGTISPETTKVEKGDNQKFEIKADKGYEVEKVLVDGKSVGAITEYTFEKVKEKHTIEATFKKVEEVTEETWKNPFTDVDEDDWYYESVKFANENKLFNGVSNTEFGPNVSMTRAMLVTVLYRLEGEPATNKSIPFADVDMSSYYASAVIWAKQNNIVNGIDDTNFAPNGEITREQLATILYRYANYKGIDVSVGENTNILSYDDFSELSEYAIPATQWACGSGIITGRTISTIAPKGTATRAEVATMLMRFTK